MLPHPIAVHRRLRHSLEKAWPVVLGKWQPVRVAHPLRRGVPALETLLLLVVLLLLSLLLLLLLLL
jgi:hypothetical protein